MRCLKYTRTRCQRQILYSRLSRVAGCVLIHLHRCIFVRGTRNKHVDLQISISLCALYALLKTLLTPASAPARRANNKLFARCVDGLCRKTSRCSKQSRLESSLFSSLAGYFYRSIIIFSKGSLRKRVYKSVFQISNFSIVRVNEILLN